METVLLNETISGMLQLKKTPSLGYIPAGSTNDFASSLKISKNMEKAAREIVNGFPVPVDAGMFCGDRSFIYIAAFGAFTEVSYQTPQDRKNLLGHQAYMIESVKSLASIKPYHMRVEWDDHVLEGFRIDLLASGDIESVWSLLIVFIMQSDDHLLCIINCSFTLFLALDKLVRTATGVLPVRRAISTIMF